MLESVIKASQTDTGCPELMKCVILVHLPVNMVVMWMMMMMMMMMLMT